MDGATIGFVGLGKAGYPMASCLARKGYKMIVHDTDVTPGLKFVEQYQQSKLAAAAGSPMDPNAFKECSAVITMLPNGKVVRDVLLGDNGIARALGHDTVVIDTSSSSPFDTRDLGRELAELSIALVDSPITQEELHGIHRGGATLMVGSDSPGALEKVMPILKDMSTYVFVMGKLGAGHAMKTLNNYVSVGSIIALCDALVTGQKLGLDPQTMIDVMNVGTGVNFSTAYSMKTLKSFDTGYQLGLLIKDVKIAKEVIERSGFESELPGLALKYLEESLDFVGQGACHTECIKSWEKRADVEIKKTDPSHNISEK